MIPADDDDADEGPEGKETIADNDSAKEEGENDDDDDDERKEVNVDSEDQKESSAVSTKAPLVYTRYEHLMIIHYLFP